MIHSPKEIQVKLNGLRTYLEKNFGQPLTRDRIDQCNQIISELENEFNSKNSS